MWRYDICTSNCADATICREDDNGRKRRFKRTVQVREAFNIKHVDFINKEHARDQLGNTLIDVSIDNSIYLGTKLLSYLSLPRFQDRTHYREKIMISI
mmetsp:Transcript_17904/g.71774  ORF Transcript_17904/g.71774 Transcript_17904/m.71774 type:complete len:98 (+) Transcript_17904:1087-1380(+)